MSLIWHMNRNNTHKGNKDSYLDNLNRKLKVKEERKGKGEVRLRRERRVITIETTCITRKKFSLHHVTNSLFVISVGSVAIQTYSPKCVTLWPHKVIRLYKLGFWLFLAYFPQRSPFIYIIICHSNYALEHIYIACFSFGVSCFVHKLVLGKFCRRRTRPNSLAHRRKSQPKA